LVDEAFLLDLLVHAFLLDVVFTAGLVVLHGQTVHLVLIIDFLLVQVGEGGRHRLVRGVPLLLELVLDLRIRGFGRGPFLHIFYDGSGLALDLGGLGQGLLFHRLATSVAFLVHASRAEAGGDDGRVLFVPAGAEHVGLVFGLERLPLVQNHVRLPSRRPPIIHQLRHLIIRKLLVGIVLVVFGLHHLSLGKRHRTVGHHGGRVRVGGLRPLLH